VPRYRQATKAPHDDHHAMQCRHGANASIRPSKPWQAIDSSEWPARRIVVRGFSTRGGIHFASVQHQPLPVRRPLRKVVPPDKILAVSGDNSRIDLFGSLVTKAIHWSGFHDSRS
jgi:hypothetical protein